MVALEGIAQRFGGRWALRGATLDVRREEVVLVTGRNGSGKSTLLRIIATALQPTRGSAHVCGFDARRNRSAVRGCVGLMGHTSGVYGDLTGSENLRFVLRMLGRRNDAQLVSEVIERVGLAYAGDAPARAYSAGMQRRLALGRLLLQAPSVALLDEPFTALDADGVACVHALVAATRAAGGATILVTHDVSHAAAVADRHLVLDHGVLHAADEQSSTKTARAERT